LCEFKWRLEAETGSGEFAQRFGTGAAAQGKVDEAIEHFRTAVQIDPSYIRPARTLERALELKRQ